MDDKSNINEVNPQKHNYFIKWMSKIHLVSMDLHHVTKEEMEDGNTGSQIDTPAPATANQFQWQQTPAQLHAEKQKFYLNPV